MKTRTKFLVLAAIWIGCVATFGCASARGTRVRAHIAGQDQVTRARFATLLVKECDLSGLAAKYANESSGKHFVTPMEHLAALGAASVTPPKEDGAGNLLSADLERAIELRLRGLGERAGEGRMHPDAPITRAELALVLEDLLVLGTGEATLPLTFLGGVSPFPDLRPDHYAFNAALVVSMRGLLVTGRGGMFEPDRAVHGDEALAALRKLNERVREKTAPHHHPAAIGAGDRT